MAIGPSGTYDFAMPSVVAPISKTPGVCGGNACVRDTRIPVWTLRRMRDLGRTDEQLLEDYPTLGPADLTAAWEYARLHPEEIADAIRRQGRPR